MMTNDSKDQGREAFEAWWESLPGATGVEADKDYEADVKGWALMSWQAALATSASALARDEASVLLPCPFCGSDAMKMQRMAYAAAQLRKDLGALLREAGSR